MQSIFDEEIDRRGTDSYKWMGDENELPMWVADMDFKAPSPVIDALKKRIEHGVYGYTGPGKGWAKAYKSFFHDLYGWDFLEENVHFVFSVVAATYAAINAYTEVGDEVALLTPIYHHFLTPIRDLKRKAVEVPFLFNGDEYEIDFALLEKAFASKRCKLFIFCNPHNPMGRLFSVDEMKRIIELAKKYGVVVFSDEIHCPIAKPGVSYNPFMKVEGASSVGFTAISPSKAFNLAGLHSAAIVVEDESLKEKLLEALSLTLYQDMNVLSSIAAETAFNEGREWLKEMNEYVYENRLYAEKYINENIPGLHAIHGEATYLMWVDCRDICGDDSFGFGKHLKDEVDLLVSTGEAFGEAGKGFIRINLATNRKRIEEGMRRLKDGATTFRMN